MEAMIGLVTLALIGLTWLLVKLVAGLEKHT